VVNSTQVQSANTLSGETTVREEVQKIVRHFVIVKVDVEGNEGQVNALPDNTLEKMPALLKRFIKSLPNGRYRIYVVEGVEGGAQTTRLIREFYKSGKSLGDPVHEVGPGSVEGQAPAPFGNPAPAVIPAPGPAGGAPGTPGAAGSGQGQDSGKMSQGAAPLSGPTRTRTRAAQGAIMALASLSPRRDWKQRLDEALAGGAGRSFRRAARILRQLRGKSP
jgi:hypothetical protein